MSTRRLTKSSTFGLLLTLALLLSLLPSGVTHHLRALVQPLQWLQRPLTGGAQAATGAVSSEDPGLSEQEVGALVREKAALERQLGHLQAALRERDRRIAELTGVRSQLLNDRAAIIVARVTAVGGDPHRDTLRLGRGSTSGVEVGQWVAAGAAISDEPVLGRELLARQWLIGKVDAVTTYECTVVLCSDPQFATEVRMARPLDGGGWEPGPIRAIVNGRGRGRMVIQASPHDLAAVGETIALVPPSADLPAEMALGRVTEARKLDSAPLHYDVTVEGWASPESLQYAYIIVPGP